MKFTDGYWLVRDGMHPLYATEVDDIRYDEATGVMTVYAATAKIRGREDTLNMPMLTVSFSAEREGVIRSRIVNYAGRRPKEPNFPLTRDDTVPVFDPGEEYASLKSGSLEVRVYREGPWRVEYWEDGRMLTSSLTKSVAQVTSDDGGEWVHEQLSWTPGESFYGLGERFGPFVKNGQTVDIWNKDGGTMSEQAYKNIPFYVSSAGYGVFVDSPAKVSYELGSEVNTRIQFSVTGQSMEYLVIAGPTIKEVLNRYTALTGRPPQVPTWSYGLWLSTSFTTDYDEKTVTSFIDGMAERDLPISVFHFDCFWMREYQWVDFTWDERMFPDPKGMLARLKEKGIRISAWINPYVGQRSSMFAEGAEHGYFLKTTDGDVFQWDLWQAGMALVDFTNPEAVKWYTDKLRVLLDQGVDTFKTDFGERVPTEGVEWFGGQDPERMRNFYTEMYNHSVFDLLKEVKGEGEAVLFARSATAGGQQYPVHWGGDCDSTFASMAESLRGGLSLGLSGFGYWSHDIGGFEGAPDPAVFKRWVPFGLLSSHSRFHGSQTYRVPWNFGEEAVEVTRKFVNLKMQLMPYLDNAAKQVSAAGTPIMRAMVMEFQEDRSAHSADTQYMLGDSLLVSPVFNKEGVGQTYLPKGTWRHLLTEEAVEGSQWVSETYEFDSLGLFVRPGSVIPLGACKERPEYAWAEDVTLLVSELADGQSVDVHVPGGTGESADFNVRRDGNRVIVATSDAPGAWSVKVLGGGSASSEGASTATVEVLP